MPELFVVFPSFCYWLVVWVLRFSLSHVQGQCSDMQHSSKLLTAHIHIWLHSLHLDSRYHRNVALPLTKVVSLCSLQNCWIAVLSELFHLLYCLFYSSCQTPAEDWGGWMLCFHTGCCTVHCVYLLVSLIYLSADAYHSLFVSFMWQVVYADISKDALKQEQASREPIQSTVYSALRFPWCSKPEEKKKWRVVWWLFKWSLFLENAFLIFDGFKDISLGLGTSPLCRVAS